ncbi:MAG: hypothetical protein AB1710_02840 [Pseudomonadota bacterium]
MASALLGRFSPSINPTQNGNPEAEAERSRAEFMQKISSSRYAFHGCDLLQKKRPAMEPGRLG